MNEKISKITIESNDPTLVVDVNKKQTKTATFIYVAGICVLLCEAIYLLFLVW